MTSGSVELGVSHFRFGLLQVRSESLMLRAVRVLEPRKPVDCGKRLSIHQTPCGPHE